MKTIFVEITEWLIRDNEAIKPYQKYHINSNHIVFISSYDEKNSQICLSNNKRFLTKGTPDEVYTSIATEIDQQMQYGRYLLRNTKK
jgi:hypothetical protein